MKIIQSRPRSTHCSWAHELARYLAGVFRLVQRCSLPGYLSRRVFFYFQYEIDECRLKTQSPKEVSITLGWSCVFYWMVGLAMETACPSSLNATLKRDKRDDDRVFSLEIVFETLTLHLRGLYARSSVF
jgi:hypothetical protein